MEYYLSFDVGTTSMKCILYDDRLNEAFYTAKEYSIITESGGIAELDAETYYNTFLASVREMSLAGIPIENIRSVTFTTQGETLIPVDKSGNALCRAVVWLDTRAEVEAEYIKSHIDSVRFYKKTGLCGIDGALPAAKILWLYNNRPDIYEKTHKILLLEDYLIYRLTGKFASEKSLQSSTGWYNIIGEKFFEEMGSICKINECMLPEILPCGTPVGRIIPKLAEELGFSSDTYVTTGAMDQIASAIGSGNINEGIVTETTGTALVVGVTTENPVFDISNPVTIYKHYDGKFIYMPYCNTAGIALKWFRDRLMPYAADEAANAGISAYEYIDEKAAQSPPGSNGVIMIPKLSEEGAFIGLSLSTDISDMARSVLEGVAYMLREIIELIENRGISITEIYSLGGGSYSPLWRQIKADVCGKNIISADYAQTTALGAAVLAAVADGKYKTAKEALAARRVEKRTEIPCAENFEVYNKNYKKYKNFIDGGNDL